MAGLYVGEIVEELAQRGVARAGGGAAIEIDGLRFHGFGALAHRVDIVALRQPDRLAADEAAHIVAPDERDVLAEASAVHVEQHLAVAGLLRRHLREHGRRSREVLAQTLGEVAIDLAVLLLALDGERQDLAVVQLGKRLLRTEGEGGEMHARLIGTIPKLACTSRAA